MDESLLLRNRLVDSHGMISSSAFYNYLTAWYSNDPMAYTHSQAQIMPQPKLWIHNAMDHGLLVPKSKPIQFARIPFYLYNLGETEVSVGIVLSHEPISKIYNCIHTCDISGLILDHV